MERCVVRIFTGRHEWNCRWPALLLPDERTYAPRQRNHDRHQARTILRGVSTGGGYTSFASNGPGSTATLAASCRGRNSPGCLHYLCRIAKDDCAVELASC